MRGDTRKLIPLAVVAMTAALTFAAAIPDGLAHDIKALSEAEIAAQGGVRLTGAQIVAINVGDTLIVIRLTTGGQTAKGGVGYVFHRDAKNRVALATDQRKYEQLWWIEGDLACAENKAHKDGHICASVYRLGDGFYSCERNLPVCPWYFRVVTGNPQNL